MILIKSGKINWILLEIINGVNHIKEGSVVKKLNHLSFCINVASPDMVENVVRLNGIAQDKNHTQHIVNGVQGQATIDF